MRGKQIKKINVCRCDGLCGRDGSAIKGYAHNPKYKNAMTYEMQQEAKILLMWETEVLGC